ncbi:hypothetical protein BOTBODRAFT_186259 [Botryobasidium botryosum FD-172 SS1]|uniref:Uncharacterized protein n=1 Tax=Botryobasidium botryosum (strain FD-172 SS1) TaxID=930990 RepID=A0A067MMX0_BOTB1|nr:hypothetical protein BOTBODRAFT_186259 [Botryobasidium botryosum FD-172 SS1]
MPFAVYSPENIAASESSADSPPSSPATTPTTAPTTPAISPRCTHALAGNIERDDLATIPIETDAISPMFASRLALTLLQNALFLKGQVPFPVTQLGRLPPTTGKSSAATRALKKRTEFLSAIDLLTSHLYTTFLALSWTLALNKLRFPALSSDCAHAQQKSPADSCPSACTELFKTEKSKVHLMLVFGPSISTAKARCILELDGLEVVPYGLKEDGTILPDVYGDGENAGRESGEGKGTKIAGASTRVQPLAESEGNGKKEGERGSLHVEPGTETSNNEPGPAPPPTANSEGAGDDNPSEAGSSSAPSSSRLSALSSPHPVATSFGFVNLGAAERSQHDEKAIRAAERLMGLKLTCSASFGTEVAPTSTFVLLRAPRRFKHPSWLPRQNYTVTFDALLESHLADPASASVPGKKSRGAPTEGVRVVSRGPGSRDEPTAPASTPEREEKQGVNGDEGQDSRAAQEEEEEGNEMIWWQWNGKLVGLALTELL